MAVYMAYRIIEGAQEYAYVISKRPDLKDGIDQTLTDKGCGNLITA